MLFAQHQPAEYRSYLLRLWRNGPQQSWRASMQCTATGEFHHFASIEHLVDFLQVDLYREEAPAAQSDVCGANPD